MSNREIAERIVFCGSGHPEDNGPCSTAPPCLAHQRNVAEERARRAEEDLRALRNTDAELDRDRLKAREALHAAEEHEKLLRELLRERQAGERRWKEIADDLKRYADHGPDCGDIGNYACTCGVVQALARYEAARKQP